MQKMEINVFVIFLFILFGTKLTESVCTWPSTFASSTWQDSAQGDLVFDTTSMSGYTFIIDGQTINDWSCVKADTFETDGRLILVSSSSFLYFDAMFYAYLCMTFTKVTDVSYRYYQNNELETFDDNKYRIKLSLSSSLTNPATICEDASGASGPEYQFIIKTGSEAVARVDCPYSFLGEYGYTHTDSSGAVTCNAESSSWDMCADNTQMTFDYTQCSTKVAYSASNTVWCVDSVLIGTTYYVMVFNGGESESTIDNVDVFRYACFAISEDNTKASVTPQHCKTGQTASAIPANNVGATLELSTKTNCTSCPVLVAPDRGFVTVTTEGAVTTARYECETNYTLAGVSERMCQANNSWTDKAPFCSCSSPPTPADGTLVVSTDGFQANYTCDLGFSLKGLQIRQCLLVTSSAEWEDADPECVQCSSFVTPVGSNPAYTSDGQTTMISFTCDKGYTLSGTQSLSCLTDGAWDDAPPVCAKCPPLTNPISGSVSTSTDGFTTTASYTCASGYDMIGESKVTCLDTGEWNLSPPTCVCQSPITPDHGHVNADGSTASYTCDLGYTISGVTSRTCSSAGNGWSETDPTCTFCIEVAQPAGGAVSLSTDGTKTSARYACDSGYTLSGSVTITCNSNGLWNSEFMTCVQCQTLSNPHSGTVSIFTSGTISSAIYSCFEGYNLDGVTVRECLADSSWTAAEPNCSCQVPNSISNGELIADGSMAVYSCNLGYSLNGVTERSCQTDGSGWSDSDPSCVTCLTLSNPTGGSITTSTDGINTQADYTCDVGYTLNGASSITCRSDGSWNFEQSTCVSCPSLTDPDSGNIAMTTDGFITTATFSCVTGYYLSGPGSLTCRTSGSWDNNLPICKCNFPSTPANGEVSVSDTAGSSVAIYKCQSGFTLSGLATRQCQTDGAGWEGSDPTCVSCEPLSDPVSGQFTSSTNGVITTATFQCDLYTSLNGERVLSCLTGGTWDHSPPLCVSCPSLSDPASGSVIVTTDGVTSAATYSCVSGYSLTSTGILTCRSDGTWNLPEPSCICNTPPSPSNGFVTLLEDGWLASYTCNDGYELSGTSTRTCPTDGTGWQGTEPICVGTSTTTTEKPGIVSTHIAVLIVMGTVILLLLILLVIVAVLYLKVKKPRVGASTERLVEEPEKPTLMPEVPVPPRDTAKVEPRNKSLPPIVPTTKKKGTKKLKRLNLSKVPKKPVLEKSPTIISASEIDVYNLQTSKVVKDKQPVQETNENKVLESLNKPDKKAVMNVSPKAKKKSALKDLSVKTEKVIPPDPKPPSPSIHSPMSSMDIPIFDDQSGTDNSKDEVLKFERPKANTEMIDETRTDNDLVTAININSVRLPPVDKAPAGSGFVLKRKRKRLGFKNTSFKDDIRETRPRTPIEKRMRELGIDRIMTPDLLQQVPFHYIHPVITHDAPSSARSGRSSMMSSRTFASYT